MSDPEKQPDPSVVLKQLEARRVLEVQKKVGVSFSLSEDIVVEKLVQMEEEDAQKMIHRERSNGVR